MSSRTGAAIKKGRRPGKNKKASQKRARRARFIIFGLVFAGIFCYAAYWLFTPRHIDTHTLFETTPSPVETKAKEIDQCIYNTLLALNIPPGDVIFKTVEPKKDRGEIWSFSELEIRLPATLRHDNVKEALLAGLSGRIPKKSIRFALGSQQELILDLSVNARHTHRLVFVKPKEREKKPVTPPPSSLPRVAIIIDDLGYDEKLASKFLALDGIMSFSVLPHSPFQKSIAATIRRSGRDVLLHLPMEPVEYPLINPGAGALLSSMTPDDLLDQLRRNLDAVPFAVGVNNHMGSKLTQDPAKMRQIFTVLKRRDLFFIDSLTGPGSYCRQAARLLKLRFAQRHVFLDHIQDTNTIRFQIKRLISIAKKHGKAIGIGHPYPATWEALNKELPNIKKQVKLVRVSELVE